MCAFVVLSAGGLCTGLNQDLPGDRSSGLYLRSSNNGRQGKPMHLCAL